MAVLVPEDSRFHFVLPQKISAKQKKPFFRSGQVPLFCWHAILSLFEEITLSKVIVHRTRNFSLIAE